MLAFYLPQFHEIPENSKWWGQGFTEWTNVKKAKPVFEGHHQPLLPTDLGYYDLSQIDVMKKQTDLAKEYGVGGFIYYFYSFNGKRLLEKPVDNFLASDIDFPYALCWANENWTKKWDGGDSSVLMPQDYEAGFEQVIFDQLLPHLSDKRYIRHDGRPMLLIYRAQNLPDPVASIKTLKELAKSAGLGDLYVLAVASFGLTSSQEVGADGLVEFPPHNSANARCLQPPKAKPDFKGNFFDLSAFALDSLGRLPEKSHFYRGIIPGWDNTARNQNRSMIIVNDSPGVFEKWLTYLRKYSTLTSRNNSQADFIFVNAWNEWAEGAILEPSNRFGRKMLEAVKSSLETSKRVSFESSRRALAGEVEAQRNLISKSLAIKLDFFNKMKLILTLFRWSAVKTARLYLKSDPTGGSLFKAAVGLFKTIGITKQLTSNHVKLSEPKQIIQPRVLLVAHIYYEEFVEGLASKINQNSAIKQVFVTCTNEKVQEMLAQELRQIKVPFTVALIENRGRNFQSVFVTAADTIRQADVDFVSHIHSKMSLQTSSEVSAEWSKRLWKLGLENSELMARTCSILEERPETAFAYANVEDLIASNNFNWLANEDLGQELFGRLGISFPEFMADTTKFAFPVGGMFLAKIEFLRQMLEVDLHPEDFPPEKGQLDGTLQHALERFVGAFAIATDQLPVSYSFQDDSFRDPRF